MPEIRIIRLTALAVGIVGVALSGTDAVARRLGLVDASLGRSLNAAVADVPFATLPGWLALLACGVLGTVAVLLPERRVLWRLGAASLTLTVLAGGAALAGDRPLAIAAPLTLILLVAVAAMATAERRAAPGDPLLQRARSLIAGGRLDAAYNELKSAPADSSAAILFCQLAERYERTGNDSRAAGVRRTLARRLLVEPRTTDAEPRRPVRGIPQTLGRYDIEGVLGRGAMGTVYLASDTRINRSVALKVVALEREFDPAGLDAAKARFFQEAESAGRLHHPGIVMVFDAGEIGSLSYIAMEYVVGTPLSAFRDQPEPPDDRLCLELAARAAEALAYAHERRVIHRDIKPANLLYDADADTLKIMDFGVAQLADVVRTRTGVVLGTPAYMSPEQLRGDTLSGASDLYSLGVTLYELLAGQVPYNAESIKGLIEARTASPPRAITDFRPDLPPSLARLFEQALADNPADRFADGWQMADELRAAQRHLASGNARKSAAK